METDEQVEIFREFFEQMNITSTTKEIQVPFNKLSEHNPELANELLDNPEDTMNVAELVIEDMDLEGGRIPVNFIKLPKIQQRHIWEIRTEDVGKMISLKGTINKSSSIIHVCKSATFECPTCANMTKILMDWEYKELTKCPCGRKGKQNVVKKEIIDNIKLGLIDDLMDKDNVDRSVAREKLAILSDKELTSHKVDMMIKPGKKVILNGYLRYVQKIKTVEFESIFHVNSIEFVDIGWDTVKVTKKEEKEIKKLAKEGDIITRLANSIADVEGFPEIKVASLLLLAGSPNMYDKNKHLTSRGTIHVLLIGSPGVAKTYFIKRAGAISPIFSFQSANTASGKGLVVAVAQDKEIGAWVIYPGVVPMAHKGVCSIDELDKTHQDDYGDHNSAMNDMEIIVAKSNVKGRLETETSYLATANPEDRVFTEFKTYYEQIDMPQDFIDRFDIILPMVSPLAEDERDRIMETMLDRHTDESSQSIWKPEFSHKFIRKYIAYCRGKKPTPKLPRELRKVIKEKLHDLMKPRGEEQVKISFRQLESILRFAYASARLRLRDICKEDIDIAFDLKKKSFLDLGIINELGDFRWSTLEDVNEEKISDKEIIHNVLKELMPETDSMVELQNIVDRCKAKGVDEDKVEEYIEQLMRKGDIFEPKRGLIRKLA